MGVRKGEKKFRKRSSDVRKIKVGPEDDQLDRVVSEDEFVEERKEVEAQVEAEGEVEEVRAKDVGGVFEAAVKKVLGHEEKGFLGGYSLKEQKKEARVKRKLEKRKVKRKRAFEVEGGQGYVSESSESEASEDEDAKRKRLKDKQLLKKHILSQAHNRVVPSLEQPDYEKRLRRVATKGVVRLFNAVAGAQKQANEPEEPTSGLQPIPELGEQLKKSKSGGPSTAEVTRSKFLDMLRKGGDSKNIQKQQADAEKDEQKKNKPVKKKPRRK